MPLKTQISISQQMLISFHDGTVGLLSTCTCSRASRLNINVCISVMNVITLLVITLLYS